MNELLAGSPFTYEDTVMIWTQPFTVPWEHLGEEVLQDWLQYRKDPAGTRNKVLHHIAAFMGKKKNAFSPCKLGQGCEWWMLQE